MGQSHKIETIEEGFVIDRSVKSMKELALSLIDEDTGKIKKISITNFDLFYICRKVCSLKYERLAPAVVLGSVVFHENRAKKGLKSCCAVNAWS